MRIVKKSERKLDMATYLSVMRKVGYATQKIGAWTKWQETASGQVQLKKTIYKVWNDTAKAYIGEDNLGKVFFDAEPSYEEVISWLTEHGYQTERDFYLNELGMDADAYAAWIAEE